MATSRPDAGAIKRRQQLMWDQGDFAAYATQMVPTSEYLCEAVDLHAGERVLDVACGSGNTAIAAARCNCAVTGLDFVPSLLERARERAAVERLKIRFVEGDAEALPFEDGTFDAVLSTFGAMFAPDQSKAAAEMLRVCRPGGRVGMATWTPDGLAGRLQQLRLKAIPPPPGSMPPSRWGTEQGLRELMGNDVSDMTIERRQFVFRYRSVDHWLEFYQATFGPTVTAIAALDERGQRQFVDDLIATATAFNRATDGTLAAPAEYLEVVATRR